MLVAISYVSWLLAIPTERSILCCLCHKHLVVPIHVFFKFCTGSGEYV